MQQVDLSKPPKAREELEHAAAWVAKYIGSVPNANEAQITFASTCRERYKKGWCSQTEAARELGSSAKHISNCLQDRRLKETIVNGIKRVDIESLIAYKADRRRIDAAERRKKHYG